MARKNKTIDSRKNKITKNKNKHNDKKNGMIEKNSDDFTVLDNHKDGNGNKLVFLVALFAILLAMMATTTTTTTSSEDISLKHKEQRRQESKTDQHHPSTVNNTSTTSSSHSDDEDDKSNMSSSSLAFSRQIKDILLSSGAWEEHPLLITTTTNGKERKVLKKKDVFDIENNSIPTIVTTNNSGDDDDGNYYDQLSWYKSLISQHDLDHVLHPPSPPAEPKPESESPLPPYQLQAGIDYKLVTKIIDPKDGVTEWTGSLPNHLTQTLQQQVDAISNGGFSLIINKMQKRWTNITKFSRSIQTSLMDNHVDHVSCNLYLTPTPPVASGDDDDEKEINGNNDRNYKSTKKNCGFESHWDWMDVIIIQISGTKLWSVANKFYPTTLSTRDMKYKPTLDELAIYQHNRYDEFMLHPGDILYIPRGFIHNASTTIAPSSTAPLLVDDGIDNDDEGVAANDLESQPDKTPSLHLTFGIEHGCQTTIEALLHHAIEYYYFNNQDYTHIAISRSDCQAQFNGQRQVQRDIPWKDLFHFVISEIARRDATCSKNDASSDTGYSPNRGSASNHPFIKKLATSSIGSCLLRRSVPSPSYLREQFSSENNREVSNNEVVHELLQMAFDLVLEIVASDSDGRETASTANKMSTLDRVSQFIYKLEHGIGESIQSYCHPYISPMTTIPCYESISSKYIQTDQLIHQLKQIYNFLFINGKQQAPHVENIYNTWHSHVQQLRQAMWSKENDLLRSVGQSVPF